MSEHLKITYSSSIDKLCEINSSFDKGILKVAYHGDNRNGSSISKDAFERSMKTIYNCPIVCNYNRETDSIGSHDVDIVVKDNDVKIVNITQPVGVIPESAKYWWSSYEDDTGIHEYLCIEALIWKRQEAYEKIKSNGITDESMEIKVKDGYLKDGIYVIESFEFLAFCLLESAAPCYESASLEVFGLQDFKQQYSRMMEELKSELKNVAPSAEIDIHSNNYAEGGKGQLEQKIELLSKFGLTVEQATSDGLDVENTSFEELEDIITQKYSNGSISNPDSTDFSLTGEQFREVLIDALHQEKRSTDWGETNKYWYYDYSIELSEVYCWDSEDWVLYGFTFTMNGDNIEINFDSKKRKKVQIVDFDEGDKVFSIAEITNEIYTKTSSHTENTVTEKLTTAFEQTKSELEEKYNSATATINSMNLEISELREFKEQRLSAERQAQVDAVFAQFEELGDIEAFEALKQNCENLSIEEIEEKCFAIKGRNNVQKFASSKPKNTRQPIDRSNVMDDEPYGGLFKEFPPMK